MTVEALALIQQRCQRFGIDCEWQSGHMHLATNARKGRRLRAWSEGIERRYGYAVTAIRPGEIRDWIDSPRFHSGTYDPRSGHLHPLKYALGLARAAKQLGVSLHENSAVTAIEHGAGTASTATASGPSPARARRRWR